MGSNHPCATWDFLLSKSTGNRLHKSTIQGVKIGKCTNQLLDTCDIWLTDGETVIFLRFQISDCRSLVKLPRHLHRATHHIGYRDYRHVAKQRGLLSRAVLHTFFPSAAHWVRKEYFV